MPLNNLVRVKAAGGFMNPSLNLNFVPDPAGAHQNALATRRGQMENQLLGMKLADYPADRQRELDTQGVDRQRMAYHFLAKAAPTLGGVDEYLSQRDTLINQFGIPEQMLPTAEEIQSHVGTGPGYETLDSTWDRWKDRFSPQETKPVKNITRNIKVDDRWFEVEIDPRTGRELNRKPMYKLTEKQSEAAQGKAALSRLQKAAVSNPMKVYSQGIKMNDDGTVFQDPITDAPVRLKPFTNTLGKRANMKVIKQVGEHVDDAVEVYQALQDPEVQADLNKVDKKGRGIQDLWDSVAGTFGNRISRWMNEVGIAPNTKTHRLLMHIQRMGSQERKDLLGTAVTATELQSILGWLPQGGDSYDTMLGKIIKAAEEGYEEFKRFLDINKDDSNMAPFYKAWGLNRFNMPDKSIESLAQSGFADEALRSTPNQTAQPDVPAAGSNMTAAQRAKQLKDSGLSDAEALIILKKEYGE